LESSLAIDDFFKIDFWRREYADACQKLLMWDHVSGTVSEDVQDSLKEAWSQDFVVSDFLHICKTASRYSNSVVGF
jgi:hypothetical protein